LFGAPGQRLSAGFRYDFEQGESMKKENLDLHVMWHIDQLMQPFPVTIVTTTDAAGKINAAPFSLVMPFCSSPKNPQMLLIVNKNWHTAKNIEAGGEFVLNYPRADQLKDITETSRHYSSEVNELQHTRYTAMPSICVKPPRIMECYQHIECRVREIIRPSQSQINIIADVLAVSLDEGLYVLPRAQRAQTVNAPIYLGVDEEQHHVFGRLCEIDAVPIDIAV
jgi:flavin reductase (DIM6/NTAB) family NADH-FMN oxidoreductase RutF